MPTLFLRVVTVAVFLAAMFLSCGASVVAGAKRWRFGACAAGPGLVALLDASNDRNWQPDVARLASVDIDGDRITVHNLRNAVSSNGIRLHAPLGERGNTTQRSARYRPLLPIGDPPGSRIRSSASISGITGISP